jgi:hypothetical protein
MTLKYTIILQLMKLVILVYYILAPRGPRQCFLFLVGTEI